MQPLRQAAGMQSQQRAGLMVRRGSADISGSRRCDAGAGPPPAASRARRRRRSPRRTGWRLSSASCGSWLETMMSMSPSASTAHHRRAVILAAQRRAQLEEGAVGADVVLVERQMIDRHAARHGQFARLGGADHREALGAGDRGRVIAPAASSRRGARRAPA